jgi:hypothetical protein
MRVNYWGTVVLLLVSARVFAQPSQPLPDSSAGAVVTALLSSQANPSSPIDDFGVVTAIRQFISLQTSTFPVAISWAGTVPTSQGADAVSFGPLFAERPQTSGKGKLAVNFNTQHVVWKRIDGLDLQNGDIEFRGISVFKGIRTDPAVRVWNTSMTLQSFSSVLGGSFGITDDLDLGFTIPFIHVSVEGQSALTTTDFDGNPLPAKSASSGQMQGSSDGIGDVSVRVKQRLLRRPSAQVAASGEVRIPTGDAGEFRGTGHTSVRGSLIAALINRSFSPHVNFGYLRAGDGIQILRPPRPPDKTNPVRNGPLPDTYARPDLYEQLFADIRVEPSDEILYTVGFDSALPFTNSDHRTLTPRATVAVDFIGRTLRNSARLMEIPFVAGIQADGTGGASNTQPFLQRSMETLMLAVLGFKYRVGDTWLLTGNIAVPISKEGLRPGVTPIFGVEKLIRR